MKTLKSIQKNQAQLNSLLMEKWGYSNKIEEQDDDREQTPVDMPARDAARAKLIADLPVDAPPADTSDIDMPARDATRAKLVDELPDTEEETLEEEHNCKSAHPGMNHDQWSDKHR